MALAERPSKKDSGSVRVLGLGILLWVGLLGALTVLMVTAPGCSSVDTVSNDYQQSLREVSAQEATRQTVVMVLVDGMTRSALEQELYSGRLPNLQGFFLANLAAPRA